MCVFVQTRCRLAAWGMSVLALGAPAATMAASTSESTLRAAVDSDELALAALTARIGDNAVVQALADDRDAQRRLAAVRAAPYLHEVAIALQPLAAIAQGRDPELAPAAARRALQIAQALALQDPSVGELTRDAIEPASHALRTLAGSDGTSRELRLCAAEAAYLLDRLLDDSADTRP
jgi:hypothetical protein